MKKVVIRGKRDATLVDVPEPKAKRDWAVVKVHVTPMCTEYHGWLAGQKANFLGHEAVGEVVEVAQPGRVQVGDRVVVMPQYPCGVCELCVAGDYIHCQHCPDFDEFMGGPEGKATYAQYLVKPDWILPRIPDDISYERAGLALCALGPSFGAMEAMDVDALDTILITGGGPVGLGACVNALFRGARVFLVESVPWRVERAKQMGVECVIDPDDPHGLRKVLDLTEGKGVDRALDCSGTAAAERFCIDAVRRRGKVVFVGECGQDLVLHASDDLIRKGIAVMGSWHYNLNLYPEILRVIRRSPLLDLLNSHVFPMSEVQRAFEVSASHESAKILLKPWE